MVNAQVNGVVFGDLHLKVLDFYCKLQRFQNAIPAFHFVDFYHSETSISASPFSRSGNTMISQVNGVGF